MVFSPQSFKSRFLRGFARPNLFTVDIYPSAGISAQMGLSNSALISFACQKCELPGRSFVTTEHYMYGAKALMPYNTSYLPITVEFLLDASMSQKKFFDSWQSFISNPKSNFMSYYDDYVCRFVIRTFSVEGFCNYKCTLEEAFPLTINPISYDMAGGNTLQFIQVQMAYRRWLSSAEDAQNGDSGILDEDSYNTSRGGTPDPNSTLDPSKSKQPGQGGAIFFPSVGGSFFGS